MGKIIEMTGSPKPVAKTKEVFLAMLAQYGFTQNKMSKKNNIVDILVTDSKESKTTKMKLAEELGIEIMTYEELAELYSLEYDE